MERLQSCPPGPTSDLTAELKARVVFELEHSLRIVPSDQRRQLYPLYGAIGLYS